MDLLNLLSDSVPYFLTGVTLCGSCINKSFPRSQMQEYRDKMELKNLGNILHWLYSLHWNCNHSPSSAKSKHRKTRLIKDRRNGPEIFFFFPLARTWGPTEDIENIYNKFLLDPYRFYHIHLLWLVELVEVLTSV